ncbi:band-7-like membrane protein [Microbacterium phage Magritte]|nr:band-7-like membrane protein [Microbacterium phage Magritte]
MTFIFIIGILVVLIGLGITFWGFAEKILGAIVGGILLALFVGGGLIFWSTWWTNGVGEAKVMVNSADRQVIGTIEEPGYGFKAPWTDFVEFDLFSQELVYAGNSDGAPQYTGGTVNGQEITVNVGGVNGGSTQGRVDMTFRYSLDADKIKDIYSEFRGGQTQFTEQAITRIVLDTARQTPAEYSAVEFRGVKRGEAALKIQDILNEKLKPYGVEFSAVTIQDVRYSEQVEAALTKIEEANQEAETAEANQRTQAVKNETKIAQAQAEADANRLLTESLTPEVIEMKRIEAIVEAAKNGNLIIDGSDGSVLLPAK